MRAVLPLSVRVELLSFKGHILAASHPPGTSHRVKLHIERGVTSGCTGTSAAPREYLATSWRDSAICGETRPSLGSPCHLRGARGHVPVTSGGVQSGRRHRGGQGVCSHDERTGPRWDLAMSLVCLAAPRERFGVPRSGFSCPRNTLTHPRNALTHPRNARFARLGEFSAFRGHVCPFPG